MRVIDSVAVGSTGAVVLGGGDNLGNHLINNYTGGTTVLSGTLQVLYPTALPDTGVLTVAGPGSVVLSATWGHSSEAMRGTSSRPGRHGREIATRNPAADVSGSPVPALTTGVSMIPLGSGPTPVPEPSTLALLGAGLMSLLTLAGRRRKAG